jgi:hypothetical protein
MISRDASLTSPVVLSIEPYELEIEPRPDGSLIKQVYWKVYIDNHRLLLSDRARPFSASDASITLHECLACGQCAAPNIVARRIGNLVGWISPPREEIDTEALQPDDLLLFESRQYESAVRSDSVEQLPAIIGEELPRFARGIRFPDPETALYRDPESPQDPLGRNAIRALRAAFASSIASLHESTPRVEFRTIRIGFDSGGHDECVWLIGSSEGRRAILLDAYPRFPVWLTSDSIEEVLSNQSLFPALH